MLLGVAQAGHPRALRRVHHREECRRNRHAFGRNLHQAPSPISWLKAPPNEAPAFERIEHASYRRPRDQQALPDAGLREWLPSIRQHAQDQPAGRSDAELAEQARHPADHHVASLDEVHRAFGGAAAGGGIDTLEVGSHTHRHRLLDRAPEADVVDELDRSIGSIGDNLGAAPSDFAYPKALLGSTAAQTAVRGRFRSAALAGTRANVARQTDVYRLARSPIQINDGRVWFERKVAGGMSFEHTLREVMNRLRYARAST